MTKHFRSWKSKIESLAEEGIAVPPFQVDNTTLANSQVLTAICSMETNGVSQACLLQNTGQRSIESFVICLKNVLF